MKCRITYVVEKIVNVKQMNTGISERTHKYKYREGYMLLQELFGLTIIYKEKFFVTFMLSGSKKFETAYLNNQYLFSF